LVEEWRLFTAGDSYTLNKYHHLFPQKPDPGLLYVTFQQTILRDLVSTLPEEETSILNNFIYERFESNMDIYLYPWQALAVYEGQLDINLKRQYIEG